MNKKRLFFISLIFILASAAFWVIKEPEFVSSKTVKITSRKFFSMKKITAQLKSSIKNISFSDAKTTSPMVSQPVFTKKINAIVGQSKADVYVLDTKTGQKLTYSNGGHDFWLASSIKASILTQLVKADGPLTGTNNDLATNMIEISDNQSAIELFEEINGFSGIESLWAKLNMTQTHANYNGFGLSTSTAADQIKLLKYILKMPTADRSYILNLMANITTAQRFGIGAMKDPAFKNGWLNADDGSWYVNSIGYSDHERYLVAILTQNNSGQDSGQQLVSQIASSIIAK